MATITLASGSMKLAPSANLSAMPQSLFSLLQTLMDQHQWDPTIRNAALSSLVAYHAATSSDDQYHAGLMIAQVEIDANLLLGHMYGQYSSGIYGVFTMPTDRPVAPVLSEILALVTSTRVTKSRNPLPGPKS